MPEGAGSNSGLFARQEAWTTRKSRPAVITRQAPPMRMEDGAKTNFRRGDREMSAAEWLFRDYFVFLARQLCRDAAARADGKTMLSDIWETLDTAGIGGMVSRYQLHGLRIPFAGIDGGTEGTEQPVLALAGTLFTSVRQTDRFAVSCSRGWLDIPVSYEGKPEPDTYAMLAAFIENAKAEPQYKIMPEAPSSAPVAISFGGILQAWQPDRMGYPDIPCRACAKKLPD